MGSFATRKSPAGCTEDGRGSGRLLRPLDHHGEAASREWFSFRKLRAFDAPIFIHWSLLAAAAVIALFAISSPLYALLFVVSYLAVILVHELGHAFVAWHLGYPINAIGLTMLHGWCECDAPDNEWHAVFIAWGGVVAQVAIAVPVLLIATALVGETQVIQQGVGTHADG